MEIPHTIPALSADEKARLIATASEDMIRAWNLLCSAASDLKRAHNFKDHEHEDELEQLKIELLALAYAFQ